MSRLIKIESVLELLPEVDDLLPLRLELIGVARIDDDRAWSAAEHYDLLDKRVIHPSVLANKVPEIAERVRARTETTLRHAIMAAEANAARDYSGAALELVEAGEVEETSNRQHVAEAYYRKALEIGRKGRKREGEQQALRRLAWLLKDRGALEEAIETYRRMFAVARARGDREAMIVACQGIGNVLVDQGRWREARESYEQGLRLVDADIPGRLVWQLQNNLSIVARRSGNREESLEWLARAVATAEADADTSALPYLRNAEGLLRFAAGDLEGAEKLYREALIAADAWSTRATILVNLIECLLGQANVTDAERVARDLENLALARGMVAYLPHVYRALGVAATVRKDQDGFIFFEQALELCSGPLANRFELALTHYEYARFEAANGLLDSAFERMNLAESIFAEIGAGDDLRRLAHEREELRSRQYSINGGVDDSSERNGRSP